MLTEQLRPTLFKELFGQKETIDVLEKSIAAKRPISFLLWGPPGSGKTSIANIYIRSFSQSYYIFSATKGSLTELKKHFEERASRPLFSEQIILFVDEIHRLNKSQQDFFLPLVEKGELILVGATTENPSFALNKAILSRVRVLPIQPLDKVALEHIIQKCSSLHKDLNLTEDDKLSLIEKSGGDGRHLIHLLENRILFQEEIGASTPRYDRSGDDRYMWISALHKAIRGSDPNAALYILARMLHGGEDPLYLFRRLIRISVEDIGLSDPHLLPYVTSAMQAFEKMGSPEGDLLLANVVVYLALSPKSNAVYTAYNQAKQDAEKTTHLTPPKEIMNAPTKLMKQMGYGKGYQYDHDLEHAFSGQNYFPDGMEPRSYYQPVERGFERDLKKRLDYFEKLRQSKQELAQSTSHET